MMDRHIVFFGLPTYGTVGGLQRFNQRVIAFLAQRDAVPGEQRPKIVLRGDCSEHLPTGLNVEFRPSGPSVLRFLWHSLTASRGAKMLIVGHINLLPVMWLCGMLAPKAKQMLFVHGQEVWGDPKYRKPRVWDRFLLSRLDVIASVSDFTARKMAAAFCLYPDQILVFQNAVDALQGPPAKAEQGANILTVARLDFQDAGKNIDCVLRAFAVVARNLPEARLTIVGDGNMRPKLEQLSDALGLSQRVHFTGRLSDEDVDKAYQAARVFVLPSEKEGFGIVFLEAWQHKLPVICGTQDAAAEVVHHEQDGLVINPHDTHALALGMERLLRDAELAARFGQRGAQKVSRHYLPQHFNQRLKQILQTVLV